MEKLYNGICLPDVWPPRYDRDSLRKTRPAPYLINPPEVIDITIGRQLFVDRFLIEETDLTQNTHKAVKYEGNPVLYAETLSEKDETLPCACPKSGGVWWDKDDRKYKMWYEAGWLNRMAYAESEDGIRWSRPELGVVPGTNQILPYGEILPMQSYGIDYLRPDSTTVVIDQDGDPAQKYKLFLRNPGGEDQGGICMTSGDGIHWENAVFTPNLGDRSTVFYNPFRKKWVYSIRRGVLDAESGWRRTRDYAEADDFLAGSNFEGKCVPWLDTDETDRPDDYIGWKPQLYNVDAVAYESVMLGMFQIMYGPENESGQHTGAPKITELIPMFSRDGFHFTRPSNESVISAARIPGAWDRGYVQSVGGICIVKPDELWIYYAGFSGDPQKTRQRDDDWTLDGMYSGGATGIARLRRDGFVSMDGTGTLLTKTIAATGKKYLFANFRGTLTAELISADGKIAAVSEPISGDGTRVHIPLPDSTLENLCGEPSRLKFRLQSGELYSFWLSDRMDGRSGGFTAAGAPEE